MELRSAETEVKELRSLYESLRSYANEESKQTALQLRCCSLPPLSGDDISTGNDDKDSQLKPHRLSEMLKALESCRSRIEALQGTVQRFKKRLAEKDKPRYGEKTAARVKALLESFHELENAMAVAFGAEEPASNSEDTASSALAETTLVEEIRQRVLQEEAAQMKQLEAERLLKEQQQAAAKAEEERRLEEQRQAEEVARIREEQERADLAHRAERARQARQRAEEEAARADREWVAGIPVGVPGVRSQLELLIQGTSHDPQAQETALSALHRMFSQIVARPEEPNFRRVRRDHAQFTRDIGRHPGGKEILIAAGFRLGSVDDVPCFVSTEPNLEDDMDGWSAWFDLLKGTLKTIEEGMDKTRKI